MIQFFIFYDDFRLYLDYTQYIDNKRWKTDE
jgi:hypothetical protein